MTPYADLPLPPGNLGLPLLGETLAFLRDPLAFAEERQARYGRVYKTGLFGRPTVVFTAPEGIRFLLANEYRYFSVSWPATTARLLGPGSISVAEGDLHKRQRRLFQRAFDRELVSSYVPQMESIAKKHARRWQMTGELALCPAISEFTFDLACRLIIGMQDNECSEAEVRELSRRFALCTAGLFALPIPLPLAKYGRALRQRQLLLARIRRIVVARQDATDKSLAERRDALSVMLQACRAEGQTADLDGLQDQVLTLLFAGHDTSSCALANFFLLVLQHPAVLSRLRAEQDEIGREVPLRAAMLSQMPYLDQVIREVLRFIPPVGGGFRKIIAPCEFAGYQLPMGWNAFYQIAGPHRDSAIFKDPERFDPDRFAPERAEDRGQRFSYIPFGGGPRVCLGMEFARLEMAVMGALMIREFEWQLLPGQDLRIAPIPLPRPRSGLLVRVSHRL